MEKLKEILENIVILILTPIVIIELVRFIDDIYDPDDEYGGME